MLLSKIRSEFYNRIEDSVYWNESRATTLANQAQRDIAGRLDLRLQGYTELVCEADVKQYSVPSDYISNYRLYYDHTWDADEGEEAGSYNQVIKIMDGPDEIVGVVGDPDLTGSPTQAYFWAIEDRRDLFLYPVPDDAYMLQWYYYREPPELVNANDEPKLARELHQYIIDFMELRAKLQDGDISDQVFTALWENKVIMMKASSSMKDASGRRSRIPSGKSLFSNTGAEASIFSLGNDGDIIWRSRGR